jgi:acetolactate synthase regulatory subunit
MIITIHDMFSPKLRAIWFTSTFKALLNINPPQKINVLPSENRKELIIAGTSLEPFVALYSLVLRNEPGALDTVYEVLAKNGFRVLKSDCATSGRIASLEMAVTCLAPHETIRWDKLNDDLRRSPSALAEKHELLAEFLPASHDWEKVPHVAVEATVPSESTRENACAKIIIPEDILAYIGVNWNEDSSVIMSAYSRAPFGSIRFFHPSEKLVMLDVSIENIPGFSGRVTYALRNLVDIIAGSITAIQPCEETLKFYGTLMKGVNICVVRNTLAKTIGAAKPRVNVVPLGWQE